MDNAPVGRPAYAFATAAIVGLGLLVRWPALGLPWPVAKYAGSALWAAMLYTGLRVAAPRAPVARSALAAAAIAAGVELFRLYHQPALDAFRFTLVGRLLLGRIFSPANLIAYGLAIVGVALVDARARAALGERCRTGRRPLMVGATKAGTDDGDERRI
jgi:hypothetical protein